jgi:hypothetical protein
MLEYEVTEIQTAIIQCSMYGISTAKMMIVSISMPHAILIKSAQILSIQTASRTQVKCVIKTDTARGELEDLSLISVIGEIETCLLVVSQGKKAIFNTLDLTKIFSAITQSSE